jgi:hypothetical protein
MPDGKPTKYTAHYWQARAAKAETMAHAIADPKMKQLLAQVASDYRRLAERAARNEHPPQSKGGDGAG